MSGTFGRSAGPVESRPHSLLAVNNTKYEKACAELYLANQGIEKICNFEGFANLYFLYLNNNKITKLVGLEHNFRLKGLFIQNNQITTLRDSCITELRFLERLDLSNNLLKDLEGTVERLVGLNRLESLDMNGNALADVLNYRFYVIFHMPWLHLLDCHEVTDEQRIKAKRLFGTAEENKKTVSEIAFGNTYRQSQAAAAAAKALVGVGEPSLYDDLCKRVDRIKRTRHAEAARKLREFYASGSRPGSSQYTTAMPPPEWLEPPGLNERLRSNVQNLEVQLELRRVFTALDPNGKAIDRAQARAAVAAMQFTHRPDAAALEAVLADFEKGAGKLSLKDFSVGISTIPQWHKHSKNDCVAGAKALRKQAEELLAGGQSEPARQLMAVATRLDPRMQAPLEPPPMPAPHYEFPPHMMKDTYQTLHLNYGHEKLFADVDQLARDFASKNALSSSLNRSASKTSTTTPLPQRSASSASLASSSSALPALGSSSSGSGSAGGLANTIGVHDAQRLKTHLLSSAKHNKPQLEFVTHNLYANAPHPPLYIAGDDYFNKTLPHRDRLEPAAAYSGTATLRPIQRSAGATLGHSSTTPLGKSASLKAVGGAAGTAASASAGKSATKTQLQKTAPARHGHGHDQIEPEDYVPKSFDFPDSDDEGGESAPAAGGH